MKNLLIFALCRVIIKTMEEASFFKILAKEILPCLLSVNLSKASKRALSFLKSFSRSLSRFSAKTMTKQPATHNFYLLKSLLFIKEETLSFYSAIKHLLLASLTWTFIILFINSSLLVLYSTTI